MKKQLLSIFATLSVSAALAQVPALDWATNQDATYPAPAAATLPGVKFMDAVDANVVWVIGKDYGNTGNNRNYNWYSRSINGGATFAGGNVYSDTNTYVIANMEAIDANTAWVCGFKKVGPGGGQGGGAIHRTSNGGTNWINMTASGMFTNTASFANFVTFLTPSVGIANGDPVNGEYEIWRTTDGGLSWTQIPGSSIPNPGAGEFAITNLYTKVGTSNLWFGTNTNVMYYSTDAGLTYNASTVGSSASTTITEIAFSSPLEGVCYTFDGAALGLWNTYNGGASWTQILPLPANLGLSDVVPIPGTGNLASFGLGGGNEIMSYSSDNGLSWTDWGSTVIPYVTGDFVDGSTAWAGSIDFSDGTTNFTDIWKYTGAGITGTMVPAAAFSVPATICFASPSSSVMPVNTSFGSGALTYSWTVLPAGATLSSGTAASPTITFGSANSYTVILVATNAVGSNTTSWVINVAACTSPNPTFTIPTACNNVSVVTSNASTGFPTPSYSWSVSPSANVTITPSPASANPGFIFGTSGIYTITLVTLNAAGTAQTTKTVNAAPCVATGTIGLTFGCNATNSLATTATFSNPVGGTMTYTWSVVGPTGAKTPTYSGGVSSSNVRATLGSDAAGDYTVTVRVKNASGTATITQVIDANGYKCTGISENNDLSTNLSVYPNPAHEQINISVPSSVDTYKVRLTNILGSVVYEEKAIKNSKETTVINLSGKTKGVYFLTVESNTEKVTKKIVIE